MIRSLLKLVFVAECFGYIGAVLLGIQFTSHRYVSEWDAGDLLASLGVMTLLAMGVHSLGLVVGYWLGRLNLLLSIIDRHLKRSSRCTDRHDYSAT